MHPGGGDRLIHQLANLLQQQGRGAGQLLAGQLCLQPFFQLAQGVAAALLLREGDLALLGAPDQLVAQLVGPQVGKAAQLAAGLAVELQILQLAGGIETVKTALGADVVDGGCIPEQRVGQRLAGFEHLVHAEQRHHPLHRQADVEVVAANPLAAVAEQIVGAIEPVAVARAHPQHRAVGSPAADIHHQHHGVFGEARLEFKTGCHRFVEKLHLLEAGDAGRLAQNGDGLTVALFASQALKVDRTADHRLTDRSAELLFRLLTDVEHHGADDIFEQGDLGGLEAVGAEEGFRRLDVVALVRLLQIALQRRGAKAELVDQPLFAHLAPHRLGPGHHGAAQLEILALLAVGQPFGQQTGDGIPVRRVQGGGEVAGGAEIEQPRAALFHHGHGTVGGTVIKSDKHGQSDS